MTPELDPARLERAVNASIRMRVEELREHIGILTGQLARIANIPVGGGCPCRGMGASIAVGWEWPCPNDCPSPAVSLWANNRRKALRHD